MSSMSVFNLPTEFNPDTQLALYCVPLLGDIVRLATVVNTFKTLNPGLELSPEDVRSTRIDFGKWIIGMIPAAIIGAICPITGVISAIIGLAAVFASIAEQATIISHKPLTGRAAAL